jgi:hypothetical protein
VILHTEPTMLGRGEYDFSGPAAKVRAHRAVHAAVHGRAADGQGRAERVQGHVRAPPREASP